MPILTVVCYAAFGRCHRDDYWFLRGDEGEGVHLWEKGCGKRRLGKKEGWETVVRMPYRRKEREGQKKPGE